MFDFMYKNTQIEFSAKRKDNGMSVTFKGAFYHFIPDCNAFSVMGKVEKIIESQSAYHPQALMQGTYLFYADERFKIGKTNNLDKRLQSIRTASPEVRHFGITHKYDEITLHSIFRTHKIKGEWYNLSHFDLRDLQWIFNDQVNDDFKYVVMFDAAFRKPLVKDLKSEDEKREKYLNFRLPNGKHKGFLLHEMKSPETVGYLEWLKINMGNGSIKTNYCYFIHYHLNRLKEEGIYPEFVK